METGHRRRYVARLVKHFGEMPLADFNQAVIDQAAIELHPNVTPCTRNTCVYTPVSAILRHAGVRLDLKRPKGAIVPSRTRSRPTTPSRSSQPHKVSMWNTHCC